ncbi:MAG: glutamate mutase L, partial [Candidatus Eisenbacteria bacterium]|nr:glutamate mutase L [Candidatus Eisenbacteria bacterium]
QVVGVDIGGATTDIFSVFQDVFNRTVSAKPRDVLLGRRLAEAGLPNVLRWIPFDLDESELRNRIKNKMIRPTTIPQSLEELIIEQAISREALRLAFEQHKALAVGPGRSPAGADHLRTPSSRRVRGRRSSTSSTSTSSSVRAASSPTPAPDPVGQSDDARRLLPEGSPSSPSTRSS